ncbi:hypothetical protein NDU88_000055 [Pleurodeles waltl]|uniref:Secreted protein n=1 Tax=Pleurodeles waltl TaxID=8319 RepID=A0AAV7U358_PLEWA|nr:hypothetical protein NDU88_000055 [Pleurodeles waltl]
MCVKHNGPSCVPPVPLLVCALVEVIMRFFKVGRMWTPETQNFRHILVTGYGKRRQTAISSPHFRVP